MANIFYKKKLITIMTPFFTIVNKSTFTWDQKWTRTALKYQTALKSYSVYMKFNVEN